jgi:hypothetical protein
LVVQLNKGHRPLEILLGMSLRTTARENAVATDAQYVEVSPLTNLMEQTVTTMDRKSKVAPFSEQQPHAVILHPAGAQAVAA